MHGLVEIAVGLVQQLRDRRPVGVLAAFVSEAAGARAEDGGREYLFPRDVEDQRVLRSDQRSDILRRTLRGHAARNPPRELGSRHRGWIEGGVDALRD